MRLSANQSGMGLPALVLLGAVSVFVATMPLDADARGGRGGGNVSSGGFSRSSAASGGSLSTPSVNRGAVAARRQGVGSDDGMGAGQLNGARSAGDVGGPRGARSAGDVGDPRSAQSAGGVDSTLGVTNVRPARKADPVTADQMADYRKQFQQQNSQKGVDWDARRPVDPEYGVPAPGEGVSDGIVDGDRARPAVGVGGGVAPAIVVGAASRNRADDYLDYVNTVDDPSYLAEDNCSLKAVTEVNDVKYYRCSNAWYKRGYQDGSVVYIPTDTPPGQ